MDYIFISYSSKNLQIALDVKNVLEQNGVSCWMAPECIAPGSNYTEAIPEAIEGCFAFVLVLSGEAQCSQWVTKELDMALNKNKPIVPFHVDTQALTGQYDFMLAGCQRIEAYSRVSAAYEELLGLLKRLNPNAVVIGQQAQKLEATISDTFEANVAAQTAARQNPQAVANQNSQVTGQVASVDGTAKKKKTWLPIVIAAASVICVAVIVGVVITVVKVTKSVGEAAKESFGKYSEEFGGLVSEINDGNVSVSISPEGTLNVTGEDGTNVSIGQGVIHVGGSDSEDSQVAPDAPETPDSQNSQGSQDILGGLLGGSSSSGDILGGLSDLGLDIGALTGLTGGNTQAVSGLTPEDAAMMEMVGYKSIFKLDYDIDGTAEVVSSDICNNDGKSYPKALLMAANLSGKTQVEFDLDGDYSVLMGEIASPQDCEGLGEWTVTIFVDGEKGETYNMNATSAPKAFLLQVDGKRKLVFEIECISGDVAQTLVGGTYVY